ncbi:MAG: hypothetical protein V3T72_04480, partial [Thermoanaerobaculia bacterium]
PFDERQAAASGADGHLKKPFDSQDLLAQVESLAGRSAPPPATEPPAAEIAATELEVSELEPPSLTADPLAPDAATAVEVELEPFAAAGDPAAVAPVVGESAEPFALPPVAASIEPEPTPAPSAPFAEAVEEAESISSHTAPIELPSEAAVASPAATVASPTATVASPAATVASPTATVASPAEDSAAGNGGGTLSEQDVDRVARRLAELVGEKLLREVAWEVVPDLAELIIKERIRELESQVE